MIVTFYYLNNSVVNCAILSNTVVNGYGGGLVVSRGTNTSIVNNKIVYNYSASAGNFAMFLGGANNATGIDNAALVNLTISANLIGGTNGSQAIGIAEEVATPFINVTNHVLTSNIFATNTLGFIYRNSTGAGTSTNISIADWDNVNIADNTGAQDHTRGLDNKITNL